MKWYFLVLIISLVFLYSCSGNNYSVDNPDQIINEAKQKNFEQKECYNMWDNNAYTVLDADKCFLSVALEKKDFNICKSIKGELRHYCISEVVEDRNNCLFNMLPKDLETKCLKRVAVIDKDVGSCYAINYDYEKDIHECVYLVAQASQSEEPCLSLNDPARSECLTKLSEELSN